MGKIREIAAQLRSPTVLTILLITGCYLILGWVIAINGPALDDFQKEFGVSVASVSLITASMFIGMMLGDVIATWLMERPNRGGGRGNKKGSSYQQRSFLLRALTFMVECGRGNIAQAVLFQGMTVMSAFFFLISISMRAWSFGLVLVFYLFTGVGNSLIDISANTIVSALDPALAGSLLNLLHLGFGVGATMAPYIFALFHMGKGYHVAFLVVAVGGGVMIVFLHLFLPRASPNPPALEFHMEKLSMEEEGVEERATEKGERGGEETEKGIQQRQTKAGNERGSASLLENAQPEAVNDDILEDSNELELVTSSEAIVADQPSLTPSGPSLTSSDAPLTTSHLTPATLGGAPKKMEFRHLVNFDFAMMMVSIFSYNGAEIVIGEWSYDLMEEIGYIKYGTIATSMYWAGLLSGRLANSVLGQKFSGLKGTFLLLRVSIVGSIIFPVLLIIFPRPPFSLVLFYACGLAYGGIFPFIVTIVAAVFPDSTGSTAAALGTLFFCGNFGATIFPYFTGFVAAHASVRTGMALAPMALLIVGFGIMCVWWKVKPKLGING